MSNQAIQSHEREGLIWWLWGRPGHRPGIILLGVVIFALLVTMPAPRSLIALLEMPSPIGYPGLLPGEDIVHRVSMQVDRVLSAQQVAFRAQVMVGVLVVAALFWGTEALPIGGTAALVCVLMYLFRVMPPDMVARSLMRDAVLFIFGVLALAVGVTKVGLHKRIGLLMLGGAKNRKFLLFAFCPILAIVASFLSQHAIVPFLIPVVLGIYSGAKREFGPQQAKIVAVLLLLLLCFATNTGGPGSPAAGGRNAIMIALLHDYGSSLSFERWLIYGMPFVPIASLLVGIYLYFVFNPKIKARAIRPSDRVRQEAESLSRFGGKEAQMTAIMLLVIGLWVAFSETLGLGGPALVGLVLMFVLRIVNWEDIHKGVGWEVVALYAAACGMGFGLQLTGGALWLARSFVDALPESLAQGTGLLVAISIFTSLLANCMTSGGTVATVGPVVLPMAGMGGLHLWQVGLTTAFSSSFANFILTGTPANAMAYSLGRDPDTGERLLTAGDFLKYGIPVTLISLVVLWLWTFLGYWKLIGFPG